MRVGSRRCSLIARRIPALFCAWPAVVTHGRRPWPLDLGPWWELGQHGSLLTFVDRNSRAAGSQRHWWWIGCQWVIGGRWMAEDWQASFLALLPSKSCSFAPSVDKHQSTSGGSYPHIKGLSGFLCLSSGSQPFCSNAPICTPSCPPARLLCAPSCIPATCLLQPRCLFLQISIDLVLLQSCCPLLYLAPQGMA